MELDYHELLLAEMLQEEGSSRLPAYVRALRMDPCLWSPGLAPLWTHCGLVAAPGEWAHCQVYSPPEWSKHLFTACLWTHGRCLLSSLIVRPSLALLFCAFHPPLFTSFSETSGVFQRWNPEKWGNLGEKAHPLYLASIFLSCRAQPFVAHSTTTKKWTNLKNNVRTSMENFPSTLSPLAFTCFLSLHSFTSLMHKSLPCS